MSGDLQKQKKVFVIFGSKIHGKNLTTTHDVRTDTRKFVMNHAPFANFCAQGGRAYQYKSHCFETTVPSFIALSH